MGRRWAGAGGGQGVGWVGGGQGVGWDSTDLVPMRCTSLSVREGEAAV